MHSEVKIRVFKIFPRSPKNVLDFTAEVRKLLSVLFYRNFAAEVVE
jgi:hypothetical protein